MARGRYTKVALLAALVAAITAAFTTGGPALAHGVRHALFAHNAGKVDGKSAVGARASASRRRGKLVATNASGRLPNSIIAKAPDAERLDGLDSADLAPAGGYDAQAGFFSFSSNAYDCDDLFGNLVGPSVTVDVGASGLVAIWAEAQIQDFGASVVRVQLFEESTLSSCPTILEGNAATNGGVDVKRTAPGSTAGTTGFGAPVIVQVAPGERTFTLRYGLTPDAAFPGNVSERKLWVQPL